MMDNERLNDIRHLVRKLGVEFRKGMKESLSGTPVGHVKPTDEEFVTLCAMKAAENPNIVIAMPLIDGGDEYIAKFERITGEPWESLLSTAGAVPPPAPATQEVMG